MLPIWETVVEVLRGYILESLSAEAICVELGNEEARACFHTV